MLSTQALRLRLGPVTSDANEKVGVADPTTTTVIDAVWPSAAAVTVTLPGASATMTPLDETPATAGLLVCQLGVTAVST